MNCRPFHTQAAHTTFLDLEVFKWKKLIRSVKSRVIFEKK